MMPPLNYTWSFDNDIYAGSGCRGPPRDCANDDDNVGNNYTFLMIWVILFLLLCSWSIFVIRIKIYQRQQRSNAQEEEKSMPLRRVQIMALFEKIGNQMEVTKDSLQDMVEMGQSLSCDDDLEAGCAADDTKLLIIKKKKKTNDSLGDGEEMTVPAICAICLECYNEGEFVVWSESGECPHVYHKSCLANYFARLNPPPGGGHDNENNRPCPTCRRDFFNVPPPTSGRKIPAYRVF